MREAERLSSRSFDPLRGCYPAYKKKRDALVSRLGMVGRQKRTDGALRSVCAHGVLRKRYSEVVGVCPGNWVCVWSKTKVSSGVVKREGFILAS